MRGERKMGGKELIYAWALLLQGLSCSALNDGIANTVLQVLYTHFEISVIQIFGIVNASLINIL